MSQPPARFYALIACAGTGSRAAAGASQALPKQYQSIAGQPLVLHTLAAFAQVQRLAECVVVVAPGDSFLCSSEHWHVLPCGGASRTLTVRNGLQALLARGAQPGDWVLVHDAARCLITPQLIDRLIDACAHDAVGGLLALPLADTLKVAGGAATQPRASATVERADKWLAQTPQMFRIGALAQAIDQARMPLTDEASAMQAQGLLPLLVPGSALNFKVTYPDDFALAQAVLQARALEGRT